MIAARSPAARIAVALAAGLLSSACAQPTTPPEGVRVLGERTLPWGTTFQNTTVGGLSGLDYDARSGQWVFISDDRSQHQPSRTYTAQIDVRADGLGDWRLTGTHPLLRPDGKPYPEDAVDPEEVRFDPRSHELRWTAEGDRDRPADPSIRSAAPDGGFRGELPLPPNLAMRPDSGPRDNESLESLTFAAGGSLLISAVESTLLQDGEPPDPERGALSRVTVQDRAGRVSAQHAYPVDPVFARGGGDNGIASILADERDPSRLLVLERAYVPGAGNSVRVYEADPRGATDVRHLGSLRGTEVAPMRKRLLADLSGLGLSTVDNVEGIAWGPRLPTGEHTLALVSDNNFSPAQTTQLIALAVR
ncbi:MAG: esterase-like activity of phytase family protein [Saccharopolyspora sp.]|uniref:esterase-like activity of phytase family protein n=1 Tax=Saccharopolyspora sp. TaxID=33915 RepID=UPI0025FCA06C|nr:esterase-like activity of phytase family protein [Saccharopolyspora sp.]MBQ6640340.1 esterase-like activity of phytase family protein [Saccharopolyspora sp.]